MTMDRRTVLKHLGTAGVVGALAGCAGVQEQGEGTEASQSGDGSGDSTASGDADSTTESSGPAGTAKAWYSLPDTEIPLRKEALGMYNEASKHTIEGADISDLRKKTTSAIPANQGPKTFEWAHDFVGDYYQRGFIVDKSDSISVEMDQFTDAAQGAVQFDGATVGLPHSAETVALVYNTEMVDSAPSTVSEMKTVMEEYHDPQNGTYGLGYPFDPYFTSAWAQAFGGYIFDPEEDPQLGVNTDATAKGVKFALDNFAPYMPNDPTYGPQAAAFAEGNAPFAINGPWYLSTLNEKGVDYGVAKLPTPEGGEPNPFTGITMWYFSKAMSEDGPGTQAAMDFIEWYATNEDIALRNAKEQGAIPVLDSIATSDDLPENVQGFSEAVQQGVPMPTHPKMNAVWTPYGDALTKLFNGDMDVKPALDEAAKTIRSNWE
ncbi:sugar ABC transporter substrate-binding protein [Halogeometricum limi]|uniref:Arabinogalactan oligomer / maltooligosaccharide transport system substrate-binding protein n=1 Tax=Halogeometricum limi TaxID=555875 RepID=A0A1I6G1D7_9EURY|nr:extracellular solute-binding protein [Halogeometricum limi]SFR35982.1 arabinogalactan oligomer / maltooligosaccharide transport system substrate-binding protein [Halogeometricum limi]